MSEPKVNSERARAEWQSRGCRICGGSGMAVAFHPDHGGRRITVLDSVDPMGEVRRTSIVTEAAAHCVCPAGRWMRENTEEWLKRRIPDGAAMVEGRSPWSFDAPGDDLPEDMLVMPRRFRPRRAP